MTKQRIFKWVVAVVLGALFVSSVFLMCFVNIKDKSPEKVITKEENGIISLSTKEQSKGYGFTFRFKNGKSDVLIQSENSVLIYDDSIKEKGVKVGEEYNVSVAVNEELDVARSFYSKEVKWLAKEYLSIPKIKVENSGTYFKKLFWDKINYADFYEIYYTHNGEILSVQTEESSYDLSELKGGKSDIWVIAKSNNEAFLDSQPSEKVNTTIKHKLPEIYYIQFDKNTKILSFKIDEKIDAFYLYFDSNPYTILNFVYSEEEKTVSCNIDYIYANQKGFGLKPASLDGDSIYDGELVYI